MISLIIVYAWIGVLHILLAAALACMADERDHVRAVKAAAAERERVRVKDGAEVPGK